MKSKSTAAILAFFLGGIGVHKFYLGKGGGIWYLLFFWTFIPAFVAFIDFFRLIAMGDEEFNAKYNGHGVAGNRDTSEELARLHGLMKEGVITETEFAQRKKKLL